MTPRARPALPCHTPTTSGLGGVPHRPPRPLHSPAKRRSISWNRPFAFLRRNTRESTAAPRRHPSGRRLPPRATDGPSAGREFPPPPPHLPEQREGGSRTDSSSPPGRTAPPSPPRASFTLGSPPPHRRVTQRIPPAAPPSSASPTPPRGKTGQSTHRTRQQSMSPFRSKNAPEAPSGHQEPRPSRGRPRGGRGPVLAPRGLLNPQGLPGSGHPRNRCYEGVRFPPSDDFRHQTAYKRRHAAPTRTNPDPANDHPECATQPGRRISSRNCRGTAAEHPRSQAYSDRRSPGRRWLRARCQRVSWRPRHALDVPCVLSFPGPVGGFSFTTERGSRGWTEWLREAIECTCGISLSPVRHTGEARVRWGVTSWKLRSRGNFRQETLSPAQVAGDSGEFTFTEHVNAPFATKGPQPSVASGRQSHRGEKGNRGIAAPNHEEKRGALSPPGVRGRHGSGGQPQARPRIVSAHREPTATGAATRDDRSTAELIPRKRPGVEPSPGSRIRPPGGRRRSAGGGVPPRNRTRTGTRRDRASLRLRE